MTSFSTDTMALIIRLEDRKMPIKAKEIFELSESGSTKLYIPVICLAEILYLYEKGRISCSVNDVKSYIEKFNNIQIQETNLFIIETASQIDDIKELHDRLIAATAKSLKTILITNDPIIISSKHLNTVWD